MKVAISTWNGRVSPVMDTARCLLIVETTADDQTYQTTIEIPVLEIYRLARFLGELRLDVLICGAISHQLERMLVAYGVKTHPWCRGSVDNIIDAYSRGYLNDEAFLLPGCRRRGRGQMKCCQRGSKYGQKIENKEKS